ncbi:hypothetical protein TYRP_011074 [Tyrophagus putrescentiae]|nr:hypothetical protein TYRP_011074 [Tyrophagus putrescentiae]
MSVAFKMPSSDTYWNTDDHRCRHRQQSKQSGDCNNEIQNNFVIGTFTLIDAMIARAMTELN